MNKLYKLKRLRSERNYSCADMGKLLNVSRIYYWQLENGKRKLCYYMAVKISSIFELNPDDVFYDDVGIICNKK